MRKKEDRKLKGLSNDELNTELCLATYMKKEFQKVSIKKAIKNPKSWN